MKGMISMLNKNYEILCKLNLTQNNITVNDVIRAVSHQLKNVATKISALTTSSICSTHPAHLLQRTPGPLENST